MFKIGVQLHSQPLSFGTSSLTQSVPAQFLILSTKTKDSLLQAVRGAEDPNEIV